MTAQVPAETLPVTFGLLLNLVGVLGCGDAARQVWGYRRATTCRRRRPRRIPSSTD